MKYILALDQGTTSSRAILFDETGTICARVQKEFAQSFPQPGWVEHDPLELWTSQRDVAIYALAEIDPAHVVGIGITNQRETMLVWDRQTGEPLCNAIVWQDRRTAMLCERLKADGLSSLIQRKTGLVVDPYFSATKVSWVLENVRGARARAEAGALAFGTVDSWLVWQLTGGKTHVTDVSNASRTMLFNIHTRDWDDELLDIFQVPRAMLPEIRSSSEMYADATTFQKPIPIAGIAGDQQAALFGQCCTRAGMVKNTYGTGCFMLMNTGAKPVESANHLLTTVAWQVGKNLNYALEGSVFIAGAAVQWLRDGLGIIKASADIERLATSVADTGGVYFVPAFSGLGAPHWDPHARGLIAGLTRGTSAAHIARAALDCIAYQTADVLDAMEKDAAIPIPELRVDGGASLNDYLMQFQSDILGVPVIRPQISETTALGAAYLAGLAVGLWKNENDVAAHWNAARTFDPAMSADERMQLRAGWRRALERAKTGASS